MSWMTLRPNGLPVALWSNAQVENRKCWSELWSSAMLEMKLHLTMRSDGVLSARMESNGGRRKSSNVDSFVVLESPRALCSGERLGALGWGATG